MKQAPDTQSKIFFGKSQPSECGGNNLQNIFTGKTTLALARVLCGPAATPLALGDGLR
jgi:hypothetical protein